MKRIVPIPSTGVILYISKLSSSTRLLIRENTFDVSSTVRSPPTLLIVMLLGRSFEELNTKVLAVFPGRGEFMVSAFFTSSIRKFEICWACSSTSIKAFVLLFVVYCKRIRPAKLAMINDEVAT